MSDGERSEQAMAAWSRLLRFAQQTAKAGERGMADLPITPAQYLALVVIADDGPQRQIDLAGRLDATEANVSQMVARMEANGIVERRSDGRANLIDLTADGRALLRVAQPRHLAHITSRFDGLDDEQLALLGELLAALTDGGEPGDRRGSGPHG